MVDLAIVGAGPTAASLLERLAANVPELLPDRELRVHWIDPHRAGTGRVWRPDNHAGLWMNSLAEDVTMFTDDTVQCAGPIRPGPSLFEWSQTVDDATLATVASPALIAEIRSLTGTTFPTRRVQSAYLEWYHRRLVTSLPANVTLVVHAARAIDVVDVDDRQRVALDDGTAIDADVVVLALGHLDAEPDPNGTSFAAAAAEHGLAFVPAGHTAELDLSVLRAGADVIALGFGQAFTDLLVLVTEGRGGRFVDDGTRYLPSGEEPILHVGSRRGVPYRSKIDYRLPVPLPHLPHFLTPEVVDALGAPLNFTGTCGRSCVRRSDGPTTTSCSTPTPSGCAVIGIRSPAGTRLARTSPTRLCHAEDVLDLDRINRPLAGLQFPNRAALEAHVRDHVVADVARKTDQTYSADLAMFYAMLRTFGVIGHLAVTGVISERSRVEDVNGWWFSFFMYYASGPPPARLRQLLALEDVGLVRFIGAGTTVRAEDGAFVATSTSHPEEVRAGALINAVVAAPTLSRTADELLRRLRDRGEAVEEVVTDGEWRLNTGKVVVSGKALRMVDAAGRPHPRRHAAGAFTSRPAAGAFSRPRTNAPAFRQNDAIARELLTELAAVP